MPEPPPIVRPVPGPLRAAFRYDRSRPFAAGQRRGVALTTAPGAPVVAPCRGRVRFRGRTPRGPAVTVACGGWRVVLIGVSADSGGPTAGAEVAAGQTVGRAAGPTLRLSVRRARDRWGWVAPRLVAGRPTGGAPLGPAPRPRSPAPPRPTAAPAPAPAPALSRLPDGDAIAEPAPHAALAVGLALAALGLPAARTRRRRRGSRRTPRGAAASASAGRR